MTQCAALRGLVLHQQTPHSQGELHSAGAGPGLKLHPYVRAPQLYQGGVGQHFCGWGGMIGSFTECKQIYIKKYAKYASCL